MSFSITEATTSKAYAYKCWYNYNYGGNTMQISPTDMGKLTQTWSSELATWRTYASNDENAYEISDDDYDTAKENGANSVKDKTGYNGGKGGMWVSTGTDAVLGLAGTVSAGVATGVIGGGIANVANAAGGAIKEASATAFGEKSVAVKGGKEAKSSAYLAAALAIATALKYRLSKPNKDQTDACVELQNSMNDAQASLQMAQSDMETAGDEIVDLSDEANKYNEDANNDIEDKKTEYDMYKASYDALMEKVKSGETLSEDEKTLLQELVPIMQQLGVDISDLSEETTDKVGEVYDQMGTYQETYDNAASTMGEVEGVTDYAESFDGATRSSCTVEAVSQGLNAATGYTAGAKLLAGGFWNWALGAASIAAGASSTAAALEQKDFAGKVSDEIDARKATQELNAATTDLYDENIDVYAGQMTGVEDLELDIPKDLENPDEVAAQLSGDSQVVFAQSSGTNVVDGGANSAGTGVNGNDNKDKNKKV